MGLTMDDVKYRIISDYDVPEIYIKGEKSWVISCSTNWVTADDRAPGTRVMTASIYLDSETKHNDLPVMHTISIDSTLQRIFFE